MCGIAGYLDTRADSGANELTAVGAAMAAQLTHRGPDDSGVWVDAPAGIVLAHTRLAILDLTRDGAQPMQSADGRYVVSYNGEVYDHAALRRALETRRRRFRGRSDTEVLLEAVGEWGLEDTLRRLNGMFAFALYDRVERRLVLARDRMGEKPLYYGWFGSVLVFASELKAMRAHPAFDASIDRGALALYLRHSYVPEPHSIYAGVRKLPPGTWLAVDASGARSAPRTYWSVRDVALDGLEHPFPGSDREAVEELDALLRDSVLLRMSADVPLGAFLSGGIDSSTIVALMQAQSSRPVETFSIGFHDEALDEARYANAVAGHLGTNHHELYVTGEDALEVVPDLPAIYDEPFADASQVPTYLLSRFTRTRVTVSLSGDAGDELFGGYERYAKAISMWRRLSLLPGAARSVLAALARDPSVASLVRGLRWLAPRSIRSRIATAVEFAPSPDFRALWQLLVSQWRDPPVLGGEEPPTAFTAGHETWPGGLLDQGMLLDWLTYLPSDILTKVDRASMAVSLESRIPLLDPRIIAFAWRLPSRFKQRNGTTKWILREVLDRYVPRALVERPKRGFRAPIGSWIRRELRPWARDLLAPGRLRDEGLLDVARVEAAVREHLGGERDRASELWSVLMLEAWLDEQRNRPRALALEPRPQPVREGAAT
jgi:asparagine synthase (glutamine-hydrolysing)